MKPPQLYNGTQTPYFGNSTNDCIASFIDEKTLSMRLKSEFITLLPLSSQPTIGSYYSFLDRLIGASKSEFTEYTSGFYQVLPPLVPISPRLIVKSPQYIGPCLDYVLDISDSQVLFFLS